MASTHTRLTRAMLDVAADVVVDRRAVISAGSRPASDRSVGILPRGSSDPRTCEDEEGVRPQGEGHGDARRVRRR